MTKEEKVIKAKLYYLKNKTRILATQALYKIENREAIKFKNKIYRQSEKGKEICNRASKKWYFANRDTALEKSREYKIKNSDIIKEKQRIYKHNLTLDPTQSKILVARSKYKKVAKKQRIPKWADKKYIQEIYTNCPTGYHVDHIIPLQGELVSGLHVEYNLLYLTPQENIAKSNTYPHLWYHT